MKPKLRAHIAVIYLFTVCEALFVDISKDTSAEMGVNKLCSKNNTGGVQPAKFVKKKDCDK